MQPNALSTCQKHAFFLFSSFNGAPAPDALSVFYKVETEVFAKDICDALAREYGNPDGWPKFHYVEAATLSPADQAHFHTEFAWFEFLRTRICNEGCPGTEIPPPPAVMKARFHHAACAQVQEKEGRVKASKNEALNLLLVVAQAYYKMLELVIGCPDPALDLELNTAYRCVIKSLKKILRDYECLQDFPAPFTPVVPNLCPMTLCNLKWKDVALNVQIFLGTVHEYVTTNGIRGPEPESAAGRTLALAGKEIDTAIERAAAYRRRMFDRARLTPMQHSLLCNGAQENVNHPPRQDALDITNRELKRHFDRRFDTLGHEYSDMQRENDVLKQDLAQALANLARQVEPEFFQWIFVILGTGSVNAAAHLLKIPSSTFDKHLKAYVARGGLYETLYEMVGVRKKGGGRIQIEQFNETFGKHQGVQAVAEPDVLRDLLDGLEAQNGANWKAVRDELIGIVKEEFPGN